MFSLKHVMKMALLAAALPVVAACGQMDTSSADETSATASDDSAAGNAAAVAGSMFGSDSQLSVSRALLARFVEEAQEEGEVDVEEDDTCYPLLNGGDQGPDGVTTAAYGDPGDYGSQSESMSVAEEDFCALSDGTANAGSGPDGDGLFGAFEIVDDVLFECDDEGVSSIVMQAGSFGIFRNTDDYMPQIYGHFDYLIDGETEVTLDCTIFLDENEAIAFADCSSEDGEVVVQESDTTCAHVE